MLKKFHSQSNFRFSIMFCFGGASIDVEQPAPARPKQLMLTRGAPPWLHAFLDSEDYLSNCPLNCFSENRSQDFGERLPRSHRRRYFCTECPEEGAICLGRVIAQHLKHRVLKVRKVGGVGGRVIKVRDIEPLLNISCVLRKSSANDDIAYVKLKSYRQSVWGTGSEEILCYECLRLASGDDCSSYNYCSIKCAYPNAVKIVPITSTSQDLDKPRGLIRSESCRVTSLRHWGEFDVPPPFEFSAGEKIISSVITNSTPPSSKGWRCLWSKYLSFGSSKRHISLKGTHIKKHIPQDEENCPQTPEGKEHKSSWEKVETSPIKASLGDQLTSKEEYTQEQAQSSGRPPTDSPTLVDERKPTDCETVKDYSPKSLSNDACFCPSSQDPNDSRLPKSTTKTKTPVSGLLNRVNAKEGPVTAIYWQTEQGYSYDEEVVQEKWESVRSRVLNSAGMAYATYTFENKSKQFSAETVQLFVSGFEPTAQFAEVSQELTVSSTLCDTTQAPAQYSPIINSNRRTLENPHNIHEENFMLAFTDTKKCSL